MMELFFSDPLRPVQFIAPITRPPDSILMTQRDPETKVKYFELVVDRAAMAFHTVGEY